MKVLAWDTETALFGPGRRAPKLSCVSWMQDGELGLLSYRDCLPWFLEKLKDPNTLHVGHNVAYDMAVIAAEHPELLPWIFRAYAENRVTDTMLRQQLLDNAVGKFRGYWTECLDSEGHRDEKWVPIYYSLDACYHRYTKKHLDKDTWRLRYGELREVPLDMWPAGAQTYPLDDAKSTKLVYDAQEEMLQKVKAAYERNQEHVGTPDPLADQFAQARAAFWIQLMSVWGIRTLPERVAMVEESVLAKLEELRSTLFQAGLVRKDGSRNTKAAMERMIKVRGGEENCRKTKKKRIQLDEDACRESGDLLLLDYAEIGSLGVVLNKDLPALRQGEWMPIHSSFSVFLATGRTSSADPNIQNVRRLPGIRECFVPREGKVFLDADYDGLELRTLAQVCMSKLGRSRLAEVLNGGKDPHLMVASQILRISYEEAKARRKDGDEEVDNARQVGKVANFGFPGGLGYETLIVFAAKGYNVTLTIEEAKELKQIWFETFPEMRDYFELINSYGVADPNDPGEIYYSIEQLFTKRLRGDCTYTAACNTYFQGLGADATKNAGFLIAYECYVDESSPLYGCRIVNYIHDQFILECDEEKAHDAAFRLAAVMCEGANPFLPDVPAKVSEPMVTRCWSKKAKQVFDENKRLIPWDMKFEVKQRSAA